MIQKTKQRKAINTPLGSILTIGNSEYKLVEIAYSEGPVPLFTFTCEDYEYELKLIEAELQEFIERGFHFEFPDDDDYQPMEDLLEEIAEWYSENFRRDVQPSELSAENLYRLLRKAADMINPKASDESSV